MGLYTWFSRLSRRAPDQLKLKAAESLASGAVRFSAVARERLTRLSERGYAEVYTFSATANFKDIIDKLWDIRLHPKLYRTYLDSAADLEETAADLVESGDSDVEVLCMMAMPEWYVGLSNEFVKSISKIDRKLQGKILDAIEKITVAPTDLRGNTLKPLTGDLKGLWRCRVGDYRLIYFPDMAQKKLVLVMFGARGEIYDKVPQLPKAALH
jgi:mRNA-degrading endonuclease RelE of RelBE toxin-antitoxin system